MVSKKRDNSPQKKTSVPRLGQRGAQKLLAFFYENPDKKFTMREIAKKTGVSKSNVQKYSILFKKEKLITVEGVAENNILFRTKKISYFFEKIVATGFLSFIIEELNPSCVILFGSIRKGESDKSSDIDIFVESSVGKDLNLKKFERLLGHRVELFVESDIKKLHKNLFNNIVNGIKLYGSFRIK